MQKTSKTLRSAAKNLVAYSAKDRIDHSVFGLGTILSIDERHTTIAFDEQGTRKFVTSMVKLSPSDTPAPAKRTRPRSKAKTKAKKKATTKAKATTKTKATAKTKATTKTKAATKSKATAKTKAKKKA